MKSQHLQTLKRAGFVIARREGKFIPYWVASDAGLCCSGDRAAQPLTDLKQRLGKLAKDREIIPYCRSPCCVYAFEAVASLRQSGFAARRLEDGLPQWRAAGAVDAREVVLGEGKLNGIVVSNAWEDLQ